MRSIPFSGTLPPFLPEDARPNGWAGALTMAWDPAAVNFVDVVGSADLYIEASFDRATGTVLLWNIATPDYETYTRNGAHPLMHFQVRVFLADGTQGLSVENYALIVDDVDDTPPSGLAFASGGTVAPGAIGATIGQLLVTDTDSAGPFSFTIDPTDDWQYEVVGTTLKLKPGMTVAISDGPFRAINLVVSDGLQSAAHRLDIAVVAAPGEQQVLDVLDPWEVKSGFSFKTADTVTALRGGWQIDHIEYYGTALMDVALRDGTHVWLPAVQKIEFLNGTLDMRQHGSADLVQAAYYTMLGRMADRGALGPAVLGMDAGKFNLDTLIGSLLSSGEYAQRYGNLSNEQFVRVLYGNTEGGTPYEPGVQGWKATLDAGASRVSVAQAFATWSVTLNNIDALHPHGYWLERPFGAQLASAYDVALDREPDRPGFDYWMGELEAGRIGLDNLAILFGMSAEFNEKFAGATTHEFVRALYRTALDREPDPDGFNYWVTTLDTGLQNRFNMIYAFGFSEEKLGNLAVLPAGDPFFG